MSAGCFFRGCAMSEPTEAGRARESNGAFQPVRVQQPLNALTRSSARFAHFLVRLTGARKIEYTYLNRRTNSEMKAQRFETWIVGENPQHYCLGIIKGSAQDIQQALLRYEEGSVWELSKVNFDNSVQLHYISTPVAVRVELTKSTLRRLPNQDMSKHPVPPRSVAEVSCIKSSRNTDLIALVKYVDPTKRKSKKDVDIADVELVDTSETSGNKTAAITISVFGLTKIQQLEN